MISRVVFWETKPAEELYDLQADPDNVNNLAEDSRYKDVLEELREANRQWIINSHDAGFIPEPMLFDISKTSTPYDYAHSSKYNIRRTLETAEMASSNDPKNYKTLQKLLSDNDPVIRYWAIIGLIISGQSSEKIKTELKKLLNDPYAHNRITASEALYKMGEKKIALQAIQNEIQCENRMQSIYALNVIESMTEYPRMLQKINDELGNCTHEYTRNILKSMARVKQ